MTTETHARMMRGFIVGTAMCLALSAPQAAQAQLSPAAQRAATGQANPGRVQDQLDDRAFSPNVSPSVEVRDIVLQNVPAGAENMRFKLDTIEIEGVSVYTQGDLQPVYADKLGQSISLAELYAISTALTNKYRNDGYILTQVIVPPQTIEGGRAKLKVVEGYVDQVFVDGTDDANAIKLIQAYAAQLQSTTALNAKDLERHLLLISDLPGVQARSVLGPSPTKPGAAIMRVIVERDPYDALLALDNFGSRYLGPWQVTAGGSLNSYFGNNERISAQTVIAPDSGELAYIGLGYEQPIGTNGTMLELFTSHTSTEPGFDLDQFDVRGRSQFWSAKIEHPFIRSRSRNLYGHVMFDWRDVDSKNNLELTRRDRIRAARAGGRYEFLDTLMGVGINALSLEVAQGLDIFGASNEGDARLTRPAGDPNFTKISGEAQRLQRITSSVNLLVAARGQLASSALLSSEEFGVGGVGFGRGYDSSEIIGDSGVAGKVEAQWRKPYPTTIVDDYQLYSFFDIGRVWNDDATTSALKADTASSAGFGVRADLMEDTEAGLAVAFPLNRNIQTQDNDNPRFYFNINRRF